MARIHRFIASMYNRHVCAICHTPSFSKEHVG
jgi:hypothetical protein